MVICVLNNWRKHWPLAPELGNRVQLNLAAGVRSFQVEHRFVFRREIQQIRSRISVCGRSPPQGGKQRARKSPHSCARAPHGHLLQHADWLFDTPVTIGPASRPLALVNAGRSLWKRLHHSSPLPLHASFGAENFRRFHEAGLVLGCRF